MEVLEAIETRRSIRRYKTTPVDNKTVEAVLEAARWAPSWANTQCWRFIVVRDSNIKAELVHTLLETERGDELAQNPATEAIKQAPVVIVACAELEKSGYYKVVRNGPATDKGDSKKLCSSLMSEVSFLPFSLALASCPANLAILL